MWFESSEYQALQRQRDEAPAPVAVSIPTEEKELIKSLVHHEPKKVKISICNNRINDKVTRNSNQISLLAFGFVRTFFEQISNQNLDDNININININNQGSKNKELENLESKDTSNKKCDTQFMLLSRYYSSNYDYSYIGAIVSKYLDLSNQLNVTFDDIYHYAFLMFKQSINKTATRYGVYNSYNQQFKVNNNDKNNGSNNKGSYYSYNTFLGKNKRIQVRCKQYEPGYKIQFGVVGILKSNHDNNKWNIINEQKQKLQKQKQKQNPNKDELECENDKIDKNDKNDKINPNRLVNDLFKENVINFQDIESIYKYKYEIHYIEFESDLKNFSINNYNENKRIKNISKCNIECNLNSIINNTDDYIYMNMNNGINKCINKLLYRYDKMDIKYSKLNKLYFIHEYDIIYIWVRNNHLMFYKANQFIDKDPRLFDNKQLLNKQEKILLDFTKYHYYFAMSHRSDSVASYTIVEE